MIDGRQNLKLWCESAHSKIGTILYITEYMMNSIILHLTSIVPLI